MTGHVRVTVRSMARMGHLPWASQDVVDRPSPSLMIFVSLYQHELGPQRDADGGTRPQYLYPFSSEENSGCHLAESGKFIFNRDDIKTRCSQGLVDRNRARGEIESANPCYAASRPLQPLVIAFNF